MSEQQRIKAAFEAALDCPAENRERLLEQLCAGDAAIRAEVEALLHAHAEAEGFLAGSPLSELTGLAIESNGAPSIDYAGRRIGAYELQREIGQGGMATVYLAERMDGEYRQQVALKLVSPHGEMAEITRRFKRERQILASLDHPNIARLLDGGTTEDGRPYLVMEYIAGQPITRHCRERNLPLAERLRLFQTVCAAVAYAHRNLVVHRDIKPGNILVTTSAVGPPSGGNAGTVKLLDFGIAKLLAPDLGEQKTITGLRPLTPNYASPEQLREETITTATDVYSLGVLLYELLTGAHPHDLKDRPLHEVIRLVCEEDPPPPSTRNPQLRGDLDNIVLLALRKDPRQRYQTVEQFSEDISRFLAGKTVNARPATLFYRTGKFARRNKTGVAVTATVLILLLAGLFFTLRQNRQQRYQLYAAAMRQAGQAWTEGNLVQMDALLETNRPGTGSDEWRGFEWFVLWKLLHMEKLTLRDQMGVPAAVFTASSKTLLTGRGDGRIEEWDAQSGRWLGLFATLPDGVFQMRFFANGTKLIVNCGNQGRLSIWDYTSRRKLIELPPVSSIYTDHRFFKLSPDETKMVTSSYELPIQVWDTTTGQLLQSFTAPAGFEIPPAGPAIYAPDGRLLCLVKKAKQFALWDLNANRAVVRFDPQSDNPEALIPFDPIGHFFSPDGERYYLATQDFKIRAWDFKRGGGPLHIFAGHEDQVEPPVLSQDGKLMASGSDDRTLRLWETQTGALLVTVKNAGQTFAPVFSADDKYLAAVSVRAAQTKVWEVAALLATPQILKRVQTSALSPDGKAMLTEDRQQVPIYRRWITEPVLRELPTGRNLLAYKFGDYYGCAEADCARFSADGKLLAIRRDVEQAKLVDIVILEAATGKVLTKVAGHTGYVFALGFSPDGKTFATGGWQDKLIKLWDTATWRERATLRGHTVSITSLEFSPDSKQLVSSGYEAVRVWDAALGNELLTLRGHRWRITKARLSPDGRMLASASADFTIKLWDATTGYELRTLTGHANSVYDIAFSPDGKRLASGSDDHTVRLWDVQTGTELTALRGHTGKVWRIFFTPDGKTLISSGEDGTRIWQTATEEEVRNRSSQ